MKVAIVVQRYGESVNGGAELHARYIAEHLARHVEVEVWTTCATDYVTWQNVLQPGADFVNGVPVRRFPVSRERDPLIFGRLSEKVFTQPHSIADELAWLDAEGPTSPALIAHVAKHAAQVDFCVFFSYRYYHAYYGARAAAGRAVLVPTAERDPAVGLAIFSPVFRGVSALMYNSPEERLLIQSLSENQRVPSVVVGVGSDVPAHTQPQRFRQKFDIREPYAIYVGRIDENKGCRELFSHFDAYLRERTGGLSLVLVGKSILDVPSHPRIRHLGFLDDTDKFDALAGADLLVMPSYFESLSMVALEAWALGKPVLANARCDVLKGQCIRSNAGLYYENELEFVETLRAIEQNRWIAGSLGHNGRQYFRQHYDWPVIERKYLQMFERLAGSRMHAMEPLPGWLHRRQRNCLPAADIVASVPTGPVAAPDMHVPRPEGHASPPLPERRPGHDRSQARGRGSSQPRGRRSTHGRRPSGSTGARQS